MRTDDRQANMTHLGVIFRNSAISPNNTWYVTFFSPDGKDECYDFLSLFWQGWTSDILKRWFSQVLKKNHNGDTNLFLFCVTCDICKPGDYILLFCSGRFYISQYYFALVEIFNTIVRRYDFVPYTRIIIIQRFVSGVLSCRVDKGSLHVKVKLVLMVPGGWRSQISRQPAHEGGKVVSPTHRPPLPPRKYSWYSFLLEAESTPGP